MKIGNDNTALWEMLKLPNTMFCLVAYALLNALFVSKYAERIGIGLHSAWVLAVAFVCYALLVLVLIRAVKQKLFVRVGSVMCATLFVGMIIVQYSIDPMSLRVDRWSAIDGPISYLLAGRYPYMAPTHLGGYASPFPVWQLVHIPFYILGNVGLSIFAALCFFIWAVRRVSGARAAVLVASLCLLAVPVWYEAAVRSDILANMLVVAALSVLLLQHVSVAWLSRYAILVAAAIGLLASTRLVVLLPAAVLFFPFFLRIGWLRQVQMVIAFAVVFALTFVPLIIWNSDAFFNFPYSPWNLQTRQGHISDLVFLIPLGMWLAMRWNRRDVSHYYSSTAALLLFFVSVTIFHNMMASGIYDLYDSSYDITYFTLALPFCVVGIANSLGKAA